MTPYSVEGVSPISFRANSANDMNVIRCDNSGEHPTDEVAEEVDRSAVEPADAPAPVYDEGRNRHLLERASDIDG